MSYPTDLSPDEQELARTRLAKLADKLTADGALRTPQWRAVFLRTWRHPYVPSYYPELGAPCLICIDPQRRDEWLDAVYSDQTLITKVEHVPHSRALRPGAYPVFTSSSTLPSLVLTMLEALELTDACRVLEIGTGSGYNAALLCGRLGSDQVTSVDIDPELVELAAERLAVNGHTPTLAAVDGAEGYPGGAPYDRIIASCLVAAVPSAWLPQVARGGMIMVDVRGQIGGGPGYGSFMPLRHTPALSPRHLVWTTDDEPVESVSQVDPLTLQYGNQFGFVVQWHCPDVTWHPTTEDGQAGVHLRAPDGSRASAYATTTRGGFRLAKLARADYGTE